MAKVEVYETGFMYPFTGDRALVNPHGIRNDHILSETDSLILI